MTARRLLWSIVLVTFLPLATGCSKTRNVSLANDPDAARGSQQISGYTYRDGTHHEWYGEVRTVGADSLEFSRYGSDLLAYGPRDRQSMRLARADVLSLDLREPDNVGTAVVAILAVGVLAVGIALAMTAAYFSNWDTN